MSFLFGGGRPQPSKDEKFAMLDMELEASTDMFQRIMNSFMKKCVIKVNQGHFVEGELNKGESVCLDRCVAKYMATQSLMQKKMQEMQQGGQAGGGVVFGM